MTEPNTVPETDIESDPNRESSTETEYVERTDVGVSLILSTIMASISSIRRFETSVSSF
ncbi:hypothetical protein [Haladaptatus caseinilyticus]|uniref:hypothetical protein n=1 Tax=Haladaptatus caseinilyticus TaxID=2993314 RepID=UPI00224A823D|nr:hypothetical protein [Haladaptatus caseinilyticus]